MKRSSSEKREGSSEELTGVVAELAGVLKGVDVERLQREYAGYLLHKYGGSEMSDERSS
ncbi:MAG: hypothetical protein JSV66_01375 [Trueperaceae bacterium]|nr:MAG: hypothetical protein JSV66_01375 [Trueperaceae bacterium]